MKTVYKLLLIGIGVILLTFGACGKQAADLPNEGQRVRFYPVRSWLKPENPQ